MSGKGAATLHYTTLHCTMLHYTTLHYIMLHYTTLHYTTLHYYFYNYTTIYYTTVTLLLHFTSQKLLQYHSYVSTDKITVETYYITPNWPGALCYTFCFERTRVDLWENIERFLSTCTFSVLVVLPLPFSLYSPYYTPCVYSSHINFDQIVWSTRKVWLKLQC